MNIPKHMQAGIIIIGMTILFCCAAGAWLCKVGI